MSSRRFARCAATRRRLHESSTARPPTSAPRSLLRADAAACVRHHPGLLAELEQFKARQGAAAADDDELIEVGRMHCTRWRIAAGCMFWRPYAAGLGPTQGLSSASGWHSSPGASDAADGSPLGCQPLVISAFTASFIHRPPPTQPTHDPRSHSQAISHCKKAARKAAAHGAAAPSAGGSAGAAAPAPAGSGASAGGTLSTLQAAAEASRLRIGGLGFIGGPRISFPAGGAARSAAAPPAAATSSSGAGGGLAGSSSGARAAASGAGAEARGADAPRCGACGRRHAADGSGLKPCKGCSGRVRYCSVR